MSPVSIYSSINHDGSKLFVHGTDSRQGGRDTASSLRTKMFTERAQIEAYLPVATSCYSDFDEKNWYRYAGGKESM